MRNLFKSVLVLIAVCFVFSSCKSKLNTAKMVPADAIFVSYFNTKSMLDKVPYSELKETQIFKDAFADTTLPEWGKKLLEDPQQAGIDLDKGLMMFINKGNEKSANIVVEGAVKNAGDFEKFNKNLDATAQVSKEKYINILVLKNKSVVGWNDKDFIYVINMDASGNDLESFSDSTLPKMPEGNIEEAKAYCQRLFSLQEDSSLAKDKRFSNLMDAKGDMKVWLNNERLFELSPSLGMLSMLKINDLIKDSRSTYVVEFDEGKIEAEQKTYVGKDLYNLVKKYQGDNISSEQISKIPSNDIVGFLGVNFKPEGLKEFFKLLGIDGMVNMYTNQMGFSVDDLVASQNGHWTFSVSDLKMTPNTDTTVFSKNFPEFNFLAAIGIGDKARFDKIFAVLKNFSGNDPDVNFIETDKMFVGSNNKTFADEFVAGKHTDKPEWTGELTDHPIGFFLDVNKILQKSGDAASKDSTESAMLQKSLAMWKNIISTGGEADDGAVKMKTTVNLVDKNTNSLKQLNSYIDQMYQLERTKRKASTAVIDSLITPPPVDTVHTP